MHIPGFDCRRWCSGIKIEPLRHVRSTAMMMDGRAGNSDPQAVMPSPRLDLVHFEHRKRRGGKVASPLASVGGAKEKVWDASTSVATAARGIF